MMVDGPQVPRACPSGHCERFSQDNWIVLCMLDAGCRKAMLDSKPDPLIPRFPVRELLGADGFPFGGACCPDPAAPRPAQPSVSGQSREGP